MTVNLEEITKHPIVSQALCGKVSRTRALELVIRLRLAIRDRKRSARNQADEVQAYGRPSDAYDRGMVVEVPRQPGQRLLLAALGSEGLPAELGTLIVSYLGNPSAQLIQQAVQKTIEREQPGHRWRVRRPQVGGEV